MTTTIAEIETTDHTPEGTQRVDHGAEPSAPAEETTERIFGAVLGAMETLSVSLGDELGYYRSLRNVGPATYAEIAAASGTVERYTREWLEHQTALGIVTVDDATLPADERRFSLAEGHAEALTSTTSLAYITPFANIVVAAARRIDDIAAAHRNGGGVSWEEFGDEMRIGQAAANRPLFLGPLGTEWFPSVPDVDERLRSGGRVADMATGFGWSAIGLALAYPLIQVDGFDIDEPSIEAARANAATAGVADRVHFFASDGADIGGGGDIGPGTYDVVTMFEALHDLPFPSEVLTTMRALAGDDGAVIVMDENVPDAFGATDDPIEQAMYGFSNLICLPDSMSHSGSVATGTVMRHDVVRRYAAEAGFQDATVLPIDAGMFRFYRLK